MGKEYIYALYKGDEFIDLGTKKELAKKTGCKPKTIGFMASPSYRKRSAKRKDNSKSLIVIRLEDD